jgi:hypothetical protein
MPRDDDDFHSETPTGVREFRFMQAQIQRLERRDSYMFGIDDDDGMWQKHKKEHEEMRSDVNTLMVFRAKALLLITLGGTLLGAIVGIVAILIEHALK